MTAGRILLSALARRAAAADVNTVRRTRAATFLAALLAAAFVPAAAAGPAAPQRATAARVPALERAVLRQINLLRLRHGLVPLRLSGALGAAASQHSRSMVAGGYFAHESADGSPFSTRVRRYYRTGSARYWSIGENLLWASPDVSPQRALALWLGSPPHRENLLAPRWREVGLGAVHAASAPGAFRGLRVTVLTADFGVRR